MVNEPGLQPNSDKPKRGYWYEIFIYYCPVCGRDDTYRERRYTPRPEDYDQRHHWKEAWDYCDQ